MKADTHTRTLFLGTRQASESVQLRELGHPVGVVQVQVQHRAYLKHPVTHSVSILGVVLFSSGSFTHQAYLCVRACARVGVARPGIADMMHSSGAAKVFENQFVAAVPAAAESDQQQR
jgi:hypothetical protein